jgi:flagellar biosynthesis/type III secretory pathway M-ring protein FliF/YscJ
MADLWDIVTTAMQVLAPEEQVKALQLSIEQTQALLRVAQVIFVLLAIVLAGAFVYLIFLRRRLRRLEKIEALQAAKEKASIRKRLVVKERPLKTQKKK